jgi:hypothetical protein
MKKILSLGFMLIILFSCTKLDEELYSELSTDMFPENATQAAAATVPPYGPLTKLLDHAGWWFAQEVTTDEMTAPTRLTDWDDGGKWRVLHQHTWNNETEAINTMWSHYYDGALLANEALFNLPPPVTPAAMPPIAKMKVLRSFYYYLLIDNYGDVPYETSFENAVAQPYKSKREDIFDSLVKTIEDNIQYLPASTSKYDVGKGMAFSLLAKLYLNAEVYTGTPQWEKAEAACDSVIAMGYSLEGNPLSPFVTENDASPENIFTIPFDENDSPERGEFNLHMRTLHYNSNLTFNMTVGPWNGFAVMEDHYNTYEEGDQRKEGFLVGQQYTYDGQEIVDDGAEGEKLVFDPHIPALVMDATFTPVEIRMSGARVVKFEIKLGAKQRLSNDFPLFRYADILLMKAEAIIRQGGNGDEYVNMIRSRAGLDDWSGVDLTMLLEERGREMFWEAKRRQDLIRFGEFNKSWWEKDVSSVDRNIFPIPQWAIDANPKLSLPPQ